MRGKNNGAVGSDTEAPVFVWQPPGKQVSVLLGFELVERLVTLLQAGPQEAARPVEIGGLLLGRSLPGDAVVTEVCDIELFPVSHARGQSYTLTGAERADLRRKMQRVAGNRVSAPLSVVGYFRSHSRPGLYLDQHDLAVMSDLFGAPGQVALLVAPHERPFQAGFFFWEDGDIRRQSPYSAFPFDAAALLAGGYTILNRPTDVEVTPVAAPPQTTAAVEVPAAALTVEAAPERAGKRRLRAWAAVAVLVVALVGTGWIARKAWQPADGLSLKVERAEGGLKLLWNHQSRLVRGAKRAAVQIADGDRRYTLELTNRQLALGSLMYFPNGSDVVFEVALRGPAGDTSEMLRVLAPIIQPRNAPEPRRETPAEPPALRPAPAVEANVRAPAEPPVEPVNSTRKRASRKARKREGMPADREMAAASEASRSMLVGFLPGRAGEPEMLPPPPDLPLLPQPETVAVKPFVHSFHREAAVTVSPAPVPGWRGVLHKLPLFHRLVGARNFVSPRPVRRVSLPVPPGMGAPLTVDVRVRVDQSGNVRGAELLTGEPQTVLASAAQAAARQWRFEPARVNGREVPAEVVLSFRFDR